MNRSGWKTENKKPFQTVPFALDVHLWGLNGKSSDSERELKKKKSRYGVVSIHKNEKTLISTDEYPLAGFTNMTQKLLSYPVFKVMWTDSGSIKREAGWIIQCSFLKRDKRRGESDNLSAGDKLGEWIRDEEKKRVCQQTQVTQCHLLFLRLPFICVYQFTLPLFIFLLLSCAFKKETHWFFFLYVFFPLAIREAGAEAGSCS